MCLVSHKHGLGMYPAVRNSHLPASPTWTSASTPYMSTRIRKRTVSEIGRLGPAFGADIQVRLRWGAGYASSYGPVHFLHRSLHVVFVDWSLFFLSCMRHPARACGSQDLVHVVVLKPFAASIPTLACQVADSENIHFSAQRPPYGSAFVLLATRTRLDQVLKLSRPAVERTKSSYRTTIPFRGDRNERERYNLIGSVPLLASLFLL